MVADPAFEVTVSHRLTKHWKRAFGALVWMCRHTEWRRKMANLCLMRQAEVQPRQNPENPYKEDTKAEMIHTQSMLTIDRLIGIVPLDLNIKTNKHRRSNCS